MPYIGKTPLTGAYQLCDTITTSATATYNLLVGGSAVIPGAAQNCIVSLNGVVQAPVSAYTVSGSTIVFSSTLSATDVIDFILILGNVFDIGKPTDGSVTNASVASNAAIALSKLATTGTMTFASTIGVGGATPAASGAGITFPATQSASTDANTLDDYEEGSWTASVGGTATYNNQTGTYTKIGRIVIASFDLNINLIGTGSATTISGLPFTSGSSVSGMVSPVSYFQDLNANIYWLAFRVDIGTATLVNALTTTASATSSQAVSIFKNSSRVISTVIYII